VRFTCRVAGWVGNGVAGMITNTSDDWDHSRKFPAFSTSKIIWKNMVIMVQYNVVCLIYWQ
jgi:O-acetylhomoserine/O-acetylserine sulfhydrylase-like pyridoxal-dependent enzyme